MVTASSEDELPEEATVAAYLSNRLDPTRAEAFEAYCLRHPDFARRVELELLFRVGLRQLQGPDATRRTARRRRTIFAIAAGVILVSCGLFLLSPIRPGKLLSYRTSAEVPEALLSGPRVSVTLIRTRAGAAIHRIIAPRQAGIIAIRVVPDLPPGRLGYAMRVAPEPELIPRSVTLDDLHPNADGYIEVYLPLGGLVGQTLKITVNPSPSTGTDSLSFRLQVAYAESAPADTP